MRKDLLEKDISISKRLQEIDDQEFYGFVKSYNTQLQSIVKELK
jgi:flagellar biosynthesis/type III secretory pathway chaperone